MCVTDQQRSNNNHTTKLQVCTSDGRVRLQSPLARVIIIFPGRRSQLLDALLHAHHRLFHKPPRRPRSLLAPCKQRSALGCPHRPQLQRVVAAGMQVGRQLARGQRAGQAPALLLLAMPQRRKLRLGIAEHVPQLARAPAVERFVAQQLPVAQFSEMHSNRVCCQTS